MNLFALVFSGLMLLPAGNIDGGGGKGKKEKPGNGRGDYEKYERQEVRHLRDVYEFSMPETEAATEQEVASGFSQPGLSVEPFFQRGNKYHLERDQRLQQYIDQHIKINRSIKELPGWRIQVFTGSVRNNALRAKKNLMSLYPEMSSYIFYDMPNYKVRVGDFIDHEEATMFCREVRETAFPSAFVVEEKVPVPQYKPLDGSNNEFPLNPERN